MKNKKFTYSPWGMPDFQQDIAEGIALIGTPSHGGIYVSAEKRLQMPEAIREISTFAGQGWYEEDCDAPLVYLAFPSLFPDVKISGILPIIKNYHCKKNPKLAQYVENLLKESN